MATRAGAGRSRGSQHDPIATGEGEGPHVGAASTKTGAGRPPSLPSRSDRPLKAMLVGSSGGHLMQLCNLKPWWEKHDRLWVTFDTADSHHRLGGERVVWAHHPTTRNVPNLMRNLRLAWRLFRAYHPDVVVSTGAGVAFPFFLLARVFGAKTVYIEVYDRIDVPTLTGKLCYPISDLFLLQWEEQRRFYSKGRVIGRLL